MGQAEILELQQAVEQVLVDDSLVDYLLAIVEKTRSHDSLSLGVSPRGAQALYRAAQALALLEGRAFVTPDDIKRLAVPVFAHRITLHSRTSTSPRSSVAAERLIAEILTATAVPL